jgi:hypothetical protein
LHIAEEKKLNALNELKNKATNKINLLNNEVFSFSKLFTASITLFFND